VVEGVVDKLGYLTTLSVKLMPNTTPTSVFLGKICPVKRCSRFVERCRYWALNVNCEFGSVPFASTSPPRILAQSNAARVNRGSPPCCASLPICIGLHYVMHQEFLVSDEGCSSGVAKTGFREVRKGVHNTDADVPVAPNMACSLTGPYKSH